MLVAQGVGWELGRQAPPPWVGPLCQAVALTAGLAAAKDADVGALAPAFGAVWLGSLMLPAVLFVTVAAGRPPRPLRRLLLGAVVITAGPAPPLPPGPLRRLLLGAVVITAGLALPIPLAAQGTASVRSTWWWTSGTVPVPRLAVSLFALWATVVVVALVATALHVIAVYRRTPRASRAVLRPVVYPGLA